MKFTIDAKQGKVYDVVVCGGGTAGVTAAIAAGRQGASVLLLERSFTIGGMLTNGNAGITKFTDHCKDHDVYKREVLDQLAVNPEKVMVVGGIPREFCKKMIQEGTASGTNGDCGSYILTDRWAAQRTLLDMLKAANVEILYDTRVCHVTMDGDTVTGVVAVNKEGFTQFPAKCVVDTTGDADVAALSGVEFRHGADEIDFAESSETYPGQVQSMGVMYGVGNVDFEKLFAYLDKHPDKYRMQSIAMMDLEEAKENYAKGDMCCFIVKLDRPDFAPETDRPVYDVQIYVCPSHTEAILLACGSNFNFYNGNGLCAGDLTEAQNTMLYGTHVITNLMRDNYPGFENAKITSVPDLGVRETRRIVGKYCMNAMDVMTGRDFEDSIACGGHHVDTSGAPQEVREMSMYHWRFHIPYRVMLPQKVKNLLVAGRCVSTTRVGQGATRVSATCMAMGEAAGIAATIAAKNGVSPDAIDVQHLRSMLTDTGAVI